MTHGEKVGTLFLEGYNCAQSVVLAFADEMGIPKETAARIASSFGGGLGRLFDIDVLDAGGKKLSREGLGLPPRKCLLCEQPAHACARSRTHTVMELTERIESILRKEFSHHGI